VKGFTDSLRVEIEEIDGAPVAITLIQPTAVDTPFPQHARNYMPYEPKLPSPMIDPEQVADAILDAASSPTRSKKVGAMSKINTAIAKFLPSLGDKMAASVAKRLQSPEPAHHQTGALYVASETMQLAGSTHGFGDHHDEEK
jgi:short-subunit dehydrogenase